MNTFIFTYIFSFILLSNLTYSQADKWIFILFNNDTLYDVSVEKLLGDKICISQNENFDTVNINNIEEIIKINESSIWESAGIGFGIGSIGGAVLGLASYEKPEDNGGFITFDYGPGFSAIAGGIIGGITGSIIGGSIGAVSGIDEHYYLTKMSNNDKMEFFSKLLYNEVDFTKSVIE
jgi:hypothetical protein